MADNLKDAFRNGASDVLNKAWDATERASNMSDRELYETVKNSDNKYDRAAAYSEFQNRHGEKKGGCFITTAVCAADGKPDDCYELTTFRAFRDGWLANQPDGRSLIKKYYEIAPKIVDKINRLPDASKVYRSIRAEYLEPCLALIRQGKNLECKNLYVRMVESLQNSFMK